jgi:hypothetical protein
MKIPGMKELARAYIINEPNITGETLYLSRNISAMTMVKTKVGVIVNPI